MRAQVQIVRKLKPWAGLTTFFPTVRPAGRKDIQLLRKLWHMGMMLVVVYLYLYVIPTQKMAITLLLATGGPLILFDYLRLKWKWLNRIAISLCGPFMRKRELLSLNTMTPFIMALFIIVGLFPKPVAVLAIVCLAFGDPAAGIIGIKFGKDKLIKGKSFQGSLACFTVCTILALVVLTAYGITSHYLFFISLIVGITATLGELFSSKRLDDNFLMPVATAAVTYPLLLMLTDF